MHQKHLLSALVAIATILGSSTLSQSVFAADSKAKTAAPKFTLSSKVGVALQAATKAFDENKLDAVEEKIKAAEAVEKKTDFDQFKIKEYRSYLYAKQDKSAEVLALFEQSLETPAFFESDGLKQRLRQLVGLTYKLKMYDKTIDYAKRTLEGQPDDKVMLNILGQVQYIQKQYPEARQTLQKLVDITEAAGGKPEEAWYQIIQYSANEQADQEGIIQSYEKLLFYYPNDDYWKKLLNYETRAEKSVQGRINFYRLKSDLNILESDDFLDYAALVLEYGLPSEALQTLSIAQKKNMTGDNAADKSRFAAMLAKAKTGAAQDKGQLPSYEQEAQKNSAQGKADVGLGLSYFSFEMYDKAIDALDRGLKKDGVKDPDSYRLVLAIALLRHGDTARAREQFTILADGKSAYARVAKLWGLRAHQ